MLTAVRGNYHDGIVELDERPIGVERARVVVTFIAPEEPPARHAHAPVALGGLFRSAQDIAGDPVAEALAELREERAHARREDEGND